jgi:hypothetical protein
MYTYHNAPKSYVDQQGVVHEYGPGAMNWQYSAPLRSGSLKGVGVRGLRGAASGGGSSLLGLRGRWVRDPETGMMIGYERDALDYVFGVVAFASGAAGVYHGYKRTGKTWPAVGYGALGLFLPIVGIPVMFIQGFGKRKKGRR